MAYQAFAKEEITVGATAGSLSASVYQPSTGAPAAEAYLSVEDDTIRIWLDGSTPTSSAGHAIGSGAALTIRSLSDITNLKYIRVSANAKLKVTYFR